MSQDFKICKAKGCGEEFNSVFSKHRDYCSSECYKASKKSDLKLKSFKTPKKKCRICKESFEPKNNFIPVCDNVDCKTKYAMSVVEKTKLAKEREERKKRVEEKKKMRDAITNWKNELQDEVNLIIRLIDKDLPCLAKGKYSNQVHAGHIFSRGSNQTIRYNCHNIHRQSAQSNHFQNDDGLLREGLVNEYGQDYMEFISALRRTPKLEYNNQEFHEFTLKARVISAKLKKADKVYSLKERIELRNQINLELGVYQEEFCIFNY
jgi:hypothetical protein